MKNKKPHFVSHNSIYSSSLLNSNLSGSTNQSTKHSRLLLNNSKAKSEIDFDNLFEILEQVRTTCDLSNELQTQLSERNEEVSKLQEIVGELQIHLFKEKEQNLKLTAENDELKIKDYENTKRIKALLALTGMCERKYMHFVTKKVCKELLLMTPYTEQDKVVEPKLPPKLQKLKEIKQKEVVELTGLSDDVDPQVLVLNNQLLAFKLEQHIKLSRDEIDVLLKEKEISSEERKIERHRLQTDINLLTTKLKETQNLMHETIQKLIQVQQAFEKEKTNWKEEKDRYQKTIRLFKDKEGSDVFDIFGQCIENPRTHVGKGSVKDLSEKEQMCEVYQGQILALEAEVSRLRERAHICKNKFKEKTEKMTAQVTYLKNKYEDLDRRRQLEAEGFRTDIRILRERLKELEKKLTKASLDFQPTEQQKLLITARTTLNRAKQLEKELTNMKSKISLLESNEGPLS